MKDCPDCSRGFGRRTLMRGALAAFGGALLSPVGRLFAQGPTNRRFILCYFMGGWDVMMGPDARDPSVDYSGIDHGTSVIQDARFRDPFTVHLGGDEALWGAAMHPLEAHLAHTTVFNGINMDTVAHPTGRSYAATGMRPGGNQARGSSPTTMAAASGPSGDGAAVLPNVAIGFPSYNDRYASEFSPIQVAEASDILYLLQAPSDLLPDAVESALARAIDGSPTCISPAYAGESPSDALRLSRERLRRLMRDNVAAQFDFTADTPEMASLRSLYGSLRGGASYQAAVAAQLIKSGLSQAVTVQIQTGLDSHLDWGKYQGPRLESGMTALAAMLTDLEDSGLLDATTVLAVSEFGRTPKLNGNQGRDHWFTNSMLAFGGGLRPGVCGASRQEDLGLLEIDLSTGRPSPGGTVLRPEHVFATAVAAAGLDPTPYRVDPVAPFVA